MSRKLFVATTMAVVCSVGRVATAGQVEPNGTASSSPRYQISSEAAQLFSPNRDFGQEYAVLSQPVEMPFSPNMSIVMADLRPPSDRPVTTTPQAQRGPVSIPSLGGRVSARAIASLGLDRLSGFAGTGIDGILQKAA